MERPFADKRPLGPFSQSDEFADRLLGGSNKDQQLKEGNVMLVEILGESPADSIRMLDDVVRGPLNEFAALEEIGDASGKREQVTPGRDVDVDIVYYYVDRVMDSETTVGQVEQFLRQELQGGSPGVLDVNVLEVK